MSEFVDHLAEVFVEFGPVRTRRMFGGFGLYHDDVMFGLVAYETLYLKADNQSAKLFEDKGLDQFEYMKNGTSIKMSYYLAPEEIFDDPELAKLWAERACEAALRSKNVVR